MADIENGDSEFEFISDEVQRQLVAFGNFEAFVLGLLIDVAPRIKVEFRRDFSDVKGEYVGITVAISSNIAADIITRMKDQASDYCLRFDYSSDTDTYVFRFKKS